MDKKEYDDKVKQLLSDTTTYQKLKKDPTSKYKRELITILQEWNREKAISKTLYDKMYPTTEEVPKFYGTPKIHKKQYPLRPIVSRLV